MRPAMRLPLREASYICSGCRQQAVPRVASPISNQFRRYASDGILERTRRSLWNTETPPGPKDPYSGESQLLHKEVKEEEGNATAEEGALAGGYEQADNWEGLGTIGFTPQKAWMQNGPSKADAYHRYDAHFASRNANSAANQAAVEICLLRMAGKSLDAISGLKCDANVTQMIDLCTVEGSDPNSIQFPSPQVKEELLAVFGKLGKSGKARSAQTIDLGEGAEEKVQHKGQIPLPLVDPELKFAFAKRFSALAARRVSDKVISSSATVADFVAALSTSVKEKPPNVIRKYVRRKAVGALPPNIHFSSKRLTKKTKDEEFGRKKVIHTELFTRGLVTPKPWRAPR